MEVLFVVLCLGTYTIGFAHAQAFVGNSQLASALATILGLKPQVEVTKDTLEKYPFYSPQVRFMQGRSVLRNGRQENASDAMEDKNLLFLTGQTMRHDRLIVEVEKKRNAAKRIRHAMELARGNEILPIETQASSPESSEIRDEEAFDEMHAKLLEKQAELLEKQATDAEKIVQSIQLDPKKHENELENCDILKIGPLKYIPQADELRHYIDKDTTGQITGNAFTIFYKKMPKITYFWESIEPMIFDVADSPGCFELQCNGMPQVFCASSKNSRDSWIDALTEAWFCKNMGIKGTLPSVKAAEKEEETIKKYPKPTTEKKKERKKALVDIEIGVDNNSIPHVKVNGKEHYSSAM